MQNVRLKIKAISPIHIGSGEIYEPTNFVIDNNILYYFKDEDFYLNLSEIDRKRFMQIVNENRDDSFIRVHKFVKEKKEVVKNIAYLKVKTSKGIQKEYNKVVGNIRQLEGKELKKVFNKFEIQRIQRKQLKSKNGYAYTGYIVGSALKGAISTAYQEYIFKTEGPRSLEEKFYSQDISKNIFKDFKVSDSLVTKISTKIGFALNKERFEYDFNNTNNNIKLHTQIEVIEPTSEFIVHIEYDESKLNLNKILESCNSHYLPIFESIFAEETNNKEEFISEYLSDEFFDKYVDFKPKKNQYLIRVGKHSGARAVTIDGMREINVKVSGGGPKRKPNKWETLEEETTTWLYGDYPKSNENLLPFGWMICEIIK